MSQPRYKNHPRFQAGDRVRLIQSQQRGTVKYGSSPGTNILYVTFDMAKYETADMVLNTTLERLPVIDQLAELHGDDRVG